MSRIIFWQAVMLFAAVCMSTYFWSSTAVWSALWGGLCYLIPTIMAIVNILVMKKIPALLPVALLTAEIGKIMLVCLMILMVYMSYASVNWYAFLMGLILVSQAGLFTFRKRSLL